MARPSEPENEAPALGRDPLAEDDEVIATTFFGGSVEEDREESPIVRSPQRTAPARPTQRRRKARPAAREAATHYKVVSISLYTRDIENLDAMVDELKSKGHTKANRSALIRYALDSVDIDKMPRGY